MIFSILAVFTHILMFYYEGHYGGLIIMRLSGSFSHIVDEGQNILGQNFTVIKLFKLPSPLSITIHIINNILNIVN